MRKRVSVLRALALLLAPLFVALGTFDHGLRAHTPPAGGFGQPVVPKNARHESHARHDEGTGRGDRHWSAIGTEVGDIRTYVTSVTLVQTLEAAAARGALEGKVNRIPVTRRRRHVSSVSHGKALAEIVKGRKERVAIIASGGMYHFPGTTKYLHPEFDFDPGWCRSGRPATPTRC
jgi:hypothetical protein